MDLREKAHQLPARPGVYLMKDHAGNILYVGKAKRLNKRVVSYFLPSTPQSKKNQRMIFHIADFDYQLVDTELEALLLEQTLIAKIHPPYNRLMNYAQRYVYLRITDDGLVIEKGPTPDAIGPLAIYKTIPEIKRIFNDLYHLPDPRWQVPSTLALYEKRMAPIPKLSAAESKAELEQTLRGGMQAIERLQLVQETAIKSLAFEWAQSLEQDKQLLQRFQKHTEALATILEPIPKFLWDEVDETQVKIFMTFQGKVIASQRLAKDCLSEEKAKLFTEVSFPPTEKSIPVEELDSRMFIINQLKKRPLS